MSSEDGAHGQDWQHADAASLLRETKTARQAAAGQGWQDTAARLSHLEAALEAQQASAPEPGSPDGT
jgi:hypothetical protein